ncbi:MAG: hypothetical protein IT365_06180 [Candidatus Hydrogenedentes bacterium]|nr:hypothetical protein [Candidatus Hydrogenedentota bacterium]
MQTRDRIARSEADDAAQPSDNETQDETEDSAQVGADCDLPDAECPAEEYAAHPNAYDQQPGEEVVLARWGLWVYFAEMEHAGQIFAWAEQVRTVVHAVKQRHTKPVIQPRANEGVKNAVQKGNEY